MHDPRTCCVGYEAFGDVRCGLPSVTFHAGVRAGSSVRAPRPEELPDAPFGRCAVHQTPGLILFQEVPEAELVLFEVHHG